MQVVAHLSACRQPGLSDTPSWFPVLPSVYTTYQRVAQQKDKKKTHRSGPTLSLGESLERTAG